MTSGMTPSPGTTWLSAYTGNVGLNDAQDELRMAIGDVMSKCRLRQKPRGVQVNS